MRARRKKNPPKKLWCIDACVFIFLLDGFFIPNQVELASETISHSKSINTEMFCIHSLVIIKYIAKHFIKHLLQNVSGLNYPIITSKTYHRLQTSTVMCVSTKWADARVCLETVVSQQSRKWKLLADGLTFNLPPSWASRQVFQRPEPDHVHLQVLKYRSDIPHVPVI